MKNFIKAFIAIIAAIALVFSCVCLVQINNLKQAQADLKEELAQLDEHIDYLDDEIRTLEDKMSEMTDDFILEELDTIIFERERILKQQLDKPELDSEIYSEIISLQERAQRLWDSTEGYQTESTVISYELESHDANPVIGVDGGKYILDSKLYVEAVWADNVTIDPNNKNCSVERTYTLIDPSQRGYMIIQGIDTTKQLVEFAPTVGE